MYAPQLRHIRLGQITGAGTVLSEKTVRIHVSATLVKLRVPDRTGAVAKARDAGLGTRSRRQIDPDQG
jgi:hypothetical protein